MGELVLQVAEPQSPVRHLSPGDAFAFSAIGAAFMSHGALRLGNS
ncbi:hypothetical protein ACFOSC_16165 [Streptantibioticus rubrisoli]|nr:hypothetical protein [Streptantibioticus rubrisoli]